MPCSKKFFFRRNPHRKYKKLFLIIAEGLTEKFYFDHVKKQFGANINIVNNRKKSAPKHLLKLLNDKINEIKLKKGDEAWIVVDTDSWPQEQMEALNNWEKDNHHVAVSSPNFEYWILLHYEDGNKIQTSNECSIKLKKYGYDKNKADMDNISKEMINKAIERAEKKEKEELVNFNYDLTYANTKVYKLVKSIVESVNLVKSHK